MHPEGRALLAGALNDLGAALFDAGQPRRAVKPAAKAIAIWREIVEVDPEYRGELAGTLTNLARARWEVGHAAAAIAAADEAITRFRNLVPGQPRTYRRKLAAELSDLALRLSQLGRHLEALPFAVEGVATYRAAARAGNAGEDYLARSLNTNAAVLAGLGRLDEAIQAHNEAIVVWRRLSAAAPRIELAQALFNLAGKFALQHRWAEAADVSAEAIQHYRALLAANRLMSFVPGLGSSPMHDEMTRELRAEAAMVLHNRVIFLTEAGRPDEATAASHELTDL
ncbi:MAG TPA: tetratricopeptide repeat protein [Asanoa sp.]|nr:tetratricopeptide repeat protein [Asanoa sp.]